MNRICQSCGNPFEAKNNRALYCSKRCKYQAYKKRKPFYTKVCALCGKQFRTQKADTKYCSLSCGVQDTTSKIQKQLVCVDCGTHFTFRGRTTKKRCQLCTKHYNVVKTMRSRKKKHPEVQIGIGSGRSQNTNTLRDQEKLLKRRLKYLSNKQNLKITKYRSKVITGNDFCCLCGFSKYQEALVVHHKDMDRTNNNVQNLSILCSNCHMHVHKEIRDKKVKTKEDLVQLFEKMAKVKERN